MKDNQFHWLNEPPEWNNQDSVLTMRTAPSTDFWRRTLEEHTPEGHVILDSGHFYHETVDGDFRVTVKVTGEYHDQYDQAGLMVRQDPENWIKYSPEVIQGFWADRYPYRMGSICLGCAYTREGRSEWSILPEFDENPPAFWLRIAREKLSYFVDFSTNGIDFKLVKLLSYPIASPVMVGCFAASPTGSGFTATFENFTVGPVTW